MNLSTMGTRSLAKGKLFLNQNGPTIMTVAGIAGLVATNVLTARATIKAEKLMPTVKGRIEVAKTTSEEEGEDRAESGKRLATAYAANGLDLVKVYWPSIVTGSLSALAILHAHRIMLKRNASLVAAYAALDAAYKAYRRRVAEEIGEEKEAALYRRVKIVEGTGEEGLPCEIDTDDIMPSPYARFFDEFSPNWSKTPEYNMMFLRSQQNWANDRLHAHGFLFLNEVYEALGLERSQAGQLVGWRVNGDGDGHVDFGLYDIFDESSRAFVNGLEASVLLDFNVDGVIRI